MIKIVYVLVSTDKDYYYEQTLISAFSARYWNPQAEIVLLVDEETDSYLLSRNGSLLTLVNTKIVVPFDKDISKKIRSRILKISARNLITGDYLYVDSDTVICAPLDSLDDFDGEIGAVLDRHSLISFPRDYQLAERFKAVDAVVKDGDEYYNGGVIFVRDTPASYSFFSDWKNLYERGLKNRMDYDQPSFLACNQKHHLVHLMDGIYNCQIFIGGLPYFAEARIIHAFNIKGYNDFFLINDSNFYRKIRTQHSLNEEDRNRLIHIKKQISRDYMLVYGTHLRYESSVLYHLFTDNMSMFKLTELIGSILLKIHRLFRNDR